MGAKHIGRISLLMLLLVVVTLSGATANNTALTQAEIDNLEPDTIGLLNGGIRTVEINRYDFNSDVAVVTTDLSFFNTQDTAVALNVDVEPFWEEREHTIKENYTFYFLPDLNWVKVPYQITIDPMSKYIMPVTIEMPLEEGFEKSKGGGFICMVSATRAGYEDSFAHKLFIILSEEKTDNNNTGFSLNLGFNPIYLLSVAVVGGLVVAVVIKKRRDQYYDEDEEYEDEYYEEDADPY